MTLQICTIARYMPPYKFQNVDNQDLFRCSNAQKSQAARQEKLQTASNKLQLDQGVRLDKITVELSNLTQNVAQLLSENRSRVPPKDDIKSIENQISKLTLSQDSIAEEQDLLHSLGFSSLPERHSKILKAHEETCRWIFHPQEDTPVSATYIADWLRNGDGIFWVSGKPGSGKSTFMKFNVDEPKTRELLSEWSSTQRLIIASH